MAGSDIISLGHHRNRIKCASGRVIFIVAATWFSFYAAVVMVLSGLVNAPRLDFVRIFYCLRVDIVLLS